MFLTDMKIFVFESTFTNFGWSQIKLRWNKCESNSNISILAEIQLSALIKLEINFWKTFLM